MSFIDRRTFLSLSGCTAAFALVPLSGCGGGGEDDLSASISIEDAGDAPMRSPLNAQAPQFQVLGLAHSLVITGSDGNKRRFGGVGRDQGKLNFPSGVAVVNGLAYVVETGNHRVQVFNSSGSVVGMIGEGELLYPGAIAAAQNEILVSDSRHGRIVGFTLDGRVKRVLGAGILSAPRGLVVSGGGVLVADAGLRKVLKLGSDGRVQAELGTGWVLPWDVTTDGKNAYIADASRNEIGVVSLAGKRLASLSLAFAPANLSFRNGMVHVAPQT